MCSTMKAFRVGTDIIWKQTVQYYRVCKCLCFLKLIIMLDNKNGGWQEGWKPQNLAMWFKPWRFPI